jgi:hypothetical protein
MLFYTVICCFFIQLIRTLTMISAKQLRISHETDRANMGFVPNPPWKVLDPDTLNPGLQPPVIKGLQAPNAAKRNALVGPSGLGSNLEVSSNPNPPIKSHPVGWLVIGALERTRTSDPALRRRVLYPLSYQGIEVREPLKQWWSRRESNPRPPHCERGALPTELRPH